MANKQTLEGGWGTQHQIMISRLLEDLWHTSPDVSLVCKDSRIFGNKLVLSTYSPLLQSIFKDFNFNADSITILVPETDVDHIKSLFSFILTPSTAGLNIMHQSHFDIGMKLSILVMLYKH